MPARTTHVTVSGQMAYSASEIDALYRQWRQTRKVSDFKELYKAIFCPLLNTLMAHGAKHDHELPATIINDVMVRLNHDSLKVSANIDENGKPYYKPLEIPPEKNALYYLKRVVINELLMHWRSKSKFREEAFEPSKLTQLEQATDELLELWAILPYCGEGVDPASTVVMPLNNPEEKIKEGHKHATLNFFCLLPGYVAKMKYGLQLEIFLSNVLSLRSLFKDKEDKQLAITNLSNLLGIDKKIVKKYIDELEKPELKQHILYIKKTKNHNSQPPQEPSNG